jgi:predicted small lipoprotein YifL
LDVQGFAAGDSGARRDRTDPARQRENASVTVPAVIMEPEAIRRRLLPSVLAVAVLGAGALTGCGEKSEPAVHPPTTAATTSTTTPSTTTTPAPTTTSKRTPTAPVPKTTP